MLIISSFFTSVLCWDIWINQYPRFTYCANLTTNESIWFTFYTTYNELQCSHNVVTITKIFHTISYTLPACPPALKESLVLASKARIIVLIPHALYFPQLIIVEPWVYCLSMMSQMSHLLTVSFLLLSYGLIVWHNGMYFSSFLLL